MQKPEIWDTIESGTITDSGIIALAEMGHLITDGFEPRSVKQACYELRAGNIFYETADRRENKRLEVGSSGYILRPHTYVTVIVQERIELPANVLARILTKGQLFSIGILPVCTYADPGFQGRLGITLCNASHRYIVIKPGQPIAKVEFSLLTQSVDRPYAGQHGYETEIWPIPAHLYATDAQLKAAGISPSATSEIDRTYGPIIASMAARLDYYQRRVWIQIAVTVLGFLALFTLGGRIDWIVAVLLGIATNLITTLVLFAGARAGLGPNR